MTTSTTVTYRLARDGVADLALDIAGELRLSHATNEHHYATQIEHASPPTAASASPSVSRLTPPHLRARRAPRLGLDGVRVGRRHLAAGRPRRPRRRVPQHDGRDRRADHTQVTRQ